MTSPVATELLSLRKEDVVFKMDVLVKVVLELFELLVGDYEGVADITRDRILICEMADRMDCIANLFMLPT